MKSTRFFTLSLALFLLSTQALAETALQKHVRFFDTNGDRKISMSETYNGFRRLGFGVYDSTKSSTLVNLILGYQLSESVVGWVWNLSAIELDRIHLGKHGSDTGCYDAEGNFVPARLEKMFELYDADKDLALSEPEIQKMLAGNYTDYIGNMGSKAEFGMLMKIAGEERSSDNVVVRALTKVTLNSFYEGDLFFEIAAKLAQKNNSLDLKSDL